MARNEERSAVAPSGRSFYGQHTQGRLIYVDALALAKAHVLDMSTKRAPETERERRERIKLIGVQIASAIKLEGEDLIAEQEQRRDWRWQ